LLKYMNASYKKPAAKGKPVAVKEKTAAVKGKRKEL